MKMLALLILATLLSTACSQEPPPPAAAPAQPVMAPAMTMAMTRHAGQNPALPLPAQDSVAPTPGEPPEDVLRELVLARYEVMAEDAAAAVMSTASGEEPVLRRELRSVHKESCAPAQAGVYECSVLVTTGLSEDGMPPIEKSRDIAVRWNGKSREWVLQ